jgi:transketolase
MRTAFINSLTELAADDPRLVLITGDLGFGVLDDFERRYPTQYLNAGVAEQNMTAVATGMALEGFIAFTYSIGNFPTLRCLEQLRNDAFYHEANVKVVSVGGGYSYGQLGMSHHATEDLSILRALPCVTVVAPGSPVEAQFAVEAIINTPGPAYLRLERGSDDFNDDQSVPFQLGKARELKAGTDITLIGIGGVVSEVVAATDQLEAQGVSCRVLSMHTLRPFDNQAVLAAAAETGGIVTIEENTMIGGLGGAVAEVCLESRIRPRLFKRLGIADQFTCVVGDQSYLRGLSGISCDGISHSVLELLSDTA